MKSVTIGSNTYPSRAAAMRALSDTLNTGEVPRVLCGAEETVARSLFEMHPEHDEKAGLGVASFEIGRSIGGTRCFYAVRTDGKKVGFSYEHAITGKPKAR